MRKLMAAGLLALPFTAGCAMTGGVCDCAPIPGDSTGYNPHVTYHATCPGGGCPGAPAVIVPTVPVSIKGSGDLIEPVSGEPRRMPKVKH